MKKNIIFILIIVVIVSANFISSKISSNQYNNYETGKSSYNTVNSSIVFVYEFLSDLENNFNTEYIDENFYNLVNNENKDILIEIKQNLKINDINSNEYVVVNNTSPYNEGKKINYTSLRIYISKKSENYTSKGAMKIKDDSLDANKAFDIVVDEKYPNNFKIRFVIK